MEPNGAKWSPKDTKREPKPYYWDRDLIGLYKAHILSYLEYRAPAVYHARRAVLVKPDNVQRRFLADVGVNETRALLEFSLAPIAMRRDIAMLGVLHCAALGQGPPHYARCSSADQGASDWLIRTKEQPKCTG